MSATRLEHLATSDEARRLVRELAEQTFSRVAGAPLVAGNQVRLLKDAAENYPAWLSAIRSAERTIHFESYIIHEDETGYEFAEELIRKAREGVRVRLIYDWVGGFGKTSKKFWRHLRAGGVAVRCYNPPRLASPFGWLSRDHRKMIAVDSRVGFVTGLCVGRMWVGDSQRGLEPWRDTGVEVIGPAVADVERAFAEVWATVGDPIPQSELPIRGDIPAAGDISLRVVATAPGSTGLYRLDKLVAASARKTLWLTDAYFAATISYVQALRSAAQDGVDVRLLVPGSSDITLMQALSRAAYRPLLESGVRIFEWNGPMIHAKSAVSNGHWARIGSTNLNIASWIGNCELDVVVEDEGFAQTVAEMYEEDLQHSTEIVLAGRNRVRATNHPEPRRPRSHRVGGSAGSINRTAAGAIGIGSAIGAALTSRRALGPAEATIMAGAGLVLLALALIAVFFPRVITIPLALIGGWLAVALLNRAYKLRDEKRAATGGLSAHSSKSHSPTGRDNEH